VTTNFALAAGILIVLLLTSSLFNDTLKNNGPAIDRLVGQATAPVRGLFAGAGSAVAALPHAVVAFASPLLLIALSALIYALQEPDFSFNGEALTLFAALAIGITIITYVFEGGEALVTDRALGVPAGVRIVPYALLIAAAFAIFSRVIDFHAPILYGFVATATVLAATKMDRRQEGLSIAVPSVMLLGVALIAWALLVPLRELGDEWYQQIPAATAAVVFAGSIEGLAWKMVPITFSDGNKVYRWHRLVWLVLFLVPAFLFFWVILNPKAEAFDAMLEGRVVFVLCLVAAYVAVAVLTWLFFRFFASQAHAEAGAPAQPS
jgi:hypothetical protein